jgi:hypothetical protein
MTLLDVRNNMRISSHRAFLLVSLFFLLTTLTTLTACKDAKPKLGLGSNEDGSDGLPKPNAKMSIGVGGGVLASSGVLKVKYSISFNGSNVPAPSTVNLRDGGVGVLQSAH